jgi:hypothetical protein
MDINKLCFSPPDLANLPKKHVSAFLLVGHCVNEANWLRKLILVSTLDETGHEAECNARLTLSLMLANIIAGKMHAGWMKLRAMAGDVDFKRIFDQPKINSLFAELQPLLAQESLIHRFRNSHASHYSMSMALSDLPHIAEGDVAIYGTRYDGDALSLISTLCSAGSLIRTSGDHTVADALQTLLNAVVKALDIYCTLLLEVFGYLINNYVNVPRKQVVIGNDGAVTLRDTQLRFFCVPPDTHDSDSR